MSMSSTKSQRLIAADGTFGGSSEREVGDERAHLLFFLNQFVPQRGAISNWGLAMQEQLHVKRGWSGTLPNPTDSPSGGFSEWYVGKQGFYIIYITHVLYSSVQSLSHVRPFVTPMDRSTPGLPVHHQLPESTQTHVHRIGDAIQPSHPLSSPSPSAFNLSQYQGLFQWVSSSNQVAKLLAFQLKRHSFQWTFRTDLL